MYENGCRAENNGDGVIYLPPTDTFIAGIKIPPRSLVTLPALYWEEMWNKESKVQGKTKGAAAKVRYPGREVVAQLSAPVRIVSALNGVRIGPQVSFYEPDQVEVRDREDGPELPDDLSTIKEEVAVRIVQAVNNKQKLGLWTRDRRAAVASAASTKLALLG